MSSTASEQKIWTPKISPSSSPLPPPPLPMPSLIWKLLYSRGLTTKQKVESHISPRLTDMTPPLALDGMEKAVHRLTQAFIKQEHICIYADFDLDGSAGLTLLKVALKSLGFKNVSHLQPKRLKEGYGFHKSLVGEIAKRGTQVIVTVDVGTSDFEAVEEAQKNCHIDVIITDHHLPPSQLPPAYVVINPNKDSCSSGLEHLCGTGVAFYLALALRAELKKKSLFKDDFDPKDLLDCFVIGTLTDMVPVRNENRALIKHGLLVLERTHRPGLKELLKSLSLWNQNLTSVDVTMRFAPKINALSRMEGKILPVDLFLVEGEEEARACVKEVMASYQKRLLLQRQAEEEAQQSLEREERSFLSQATGNIVTQATEDIENQREHILQNGQWDKKKKESLYRKKFVFLCSKNFHKGILGLLATKISQDFSCPTFIGCIDEERGCVLGSARAPKTEHLKLEEVKVSKDLKSENLLSALQFSASSLLKFGGHAMAAGFQLEISKIKDFKNHLKEYYNKFPFPLPAKVLYDEVGSLREINKEFMEWHGKLEPFGVQFEVPIFLIPKLDICFTTPLRGGHIKFLFREKSPKDSSSYEMEAIWFSPPKFASRYLSSSFSSDNHLSHDKTFHQTVDIIAEPQWNYFNGIKKIQLLLKNIRPSEPSFSHQTSL